MAKKASGQNAVDEAYLRSLMAGVPSEPALSSASEKEGKGLSDEKEQTENTMNEIGKNISGADDTDRGMEKPSAKTMRTALTDFVRRFLTPYKCEGRQGVYIDKELHQKISVIVGIGGKRRLTVGNYIDNVLKEHFEKHADEVKTYLQKSYNKIF